MFALALLAALSQLSGGGAGSYSAVSEITSGSHVAWLAASALESIRSQTDALSGLTFASVQSAEQQTVAGTNYRITALLAPAGVSTLTMHEQTWTDTLEVTAATLTASGSETSLLRSGLASLPVDCRSSARVWNDCGSACTPTCDDPQPMCVMMCVAQEECPGSHPLSMDGRCVSASCCSMVTSTQSTSPPPPSAMCCRGLTLECLACSASVTEAAYCTSHPQTLGCEERSSSEGRGEGPSLPLSEQEPDSASASGPSTAVVIGGVAGGVVGSAAIGAVVWKAAHAHQVAKIGVSAPA